MYEVLSGLTLFVAAGIAVFLAADLWRHRGEDRATGPRDLALTLLIVALLLASRLFGRA